jgi:hypothetical protein
MTLENGSKSGRPVSHPEGRCDTPDVSAKLDGNKLRSTMYEFLKVILGRCNRS